MINPGGLRRKTRQDCTVLGVSVTPAEFDLLAPLMRNTECQ
jgi:hypothetical protein